MDDAITSLPGRGQRESALSTAALPQGAFAHALLFTGHMIDAPGRAQPRFPAWAESRARSAIRDAITAVKWPQPGPVIALSGAASGGDLLFQECCDDLGIPALVLLALPRDEFEADSVAPGGPGWVKRFHALLERRGPDRLRVIERRRGSPDSERGDIWQRANHWMIEQASALAPDQALLALWDGKAGDGPGGTEHFLQVARQRGIRILPVIPMDTICAEARASRPSGS